MTQGVGVVECGTLQKGFFAGTLLFDAAQRRFLVRRGGTNAERRWVAGLMGVVLSSGRRLVLEIQRIWHNPSVQLP